MVVCVDRIPRRRLQVFKGKKKIKLNAKEGLFTRIFMANFPRWKNSPRKPGIPDLTYDDHVRMISKKKWSGASAKDESDTATARKPGTRMYRRPEWLHPSIGSPETLLLDHLNICMRAEIPLMNGLRKFGAKKLTT